MNIVEMDGFAANPGDLSWEPWKSICDADGKPCGFTVYDRSSREETVERAKDAEIVITNKVVFDEDIMAQLPKLKYIGVLATGYNVVDIEAARRHGITVTNIPAYSTMSVAQLTIALLLDIANNVAGHSKAVHDGQWTACPDFTFTVSRQIELAGRTFGIVGLGNTGMATAAIAAALGMKVMAFTSKEQESLPPYITKTESMDELFRMADVLSLHCPLTESTKHLVNERTLALMKRDSIILNTGRGPLIDEEALAAALSEGRVAAAGIDVLPEEPPVNGSPLLTVPNCHITPHIAWATLAARQRLMDVAVENVRAFISGCPQNVVS